jgi:hypothetical protein
MKSGAEEIPFSFCLSPLAQDIFSIDPVTLKGSYTEQEHDERIFAVFAPVDGRRRAGCAA